MDAAGKRAVQICLSQWEHTEDSMMKTDLLSNENSVQPSSGGRGKGQDWKTEVMKE